jgi:hypothetical protein
MTRLATIAFSLTATLSLPALAGEKVSTPVSVDLVARWAHGSAGTARNSADAVQKIWCGVSGNGAYASVQCVARTSSGRSATCFSAEPTAAILQAAAAVKGDSWVWFEWDAAGQCTVVEAKSGSSFEPKTE